MNETEAIGLFNEIAEEKRLKENAEFCMTVHKKSVENWTEGNILEYHENEYGVMYIKYESGNGWHYKNNNAISAETGKPCLEMW